MPALPAQHIIIRCFDEADLAAVKLFYSGTTYRNGESTQASDKIVAAFNGCETIGLFRICSENGVLVLRGFFVLPAWQRQGVGTLMLYKVKELTGGKPCYLLCKKELNSFYSHAEFKPCTQAPAFLTERMQQYNHPTLNILSTAG